MSARPFHLAIAAAATLCAGACGTYQVNRAATVPHAAPALHSGQPLDGAAELSLGASSVTDVMNPKVGDPDAAVEIPGTQAHGDLRVRINDAFALGFVYENGIAATASKPKGRMQPPVEGGNVQGAGIVGDVSIKTQNPALRVGVGFDMMIWRVPYVEYQTCVQNCTLDEPWMFVERDTDDTATFGLSVTPSYRVGNLTYFGGLTARQHPTIKQKGLETDPFLDGEGEVESGPFNLMLSAGIEAMFADGAVKGSVILYQDLTQDPVQYGPSIAALISIPLGRDKPAAAPAPAPVAPPPTGAPGTF